LLKPSAWAPAENVPAGGKAFTFLTVLFLPRDATQSAVMPQYVVCLSVCLCVCDVHVRDHSLKYFENNVMTD